MALVPEVRVNKNGVPVTKHVNADKNSAGPQQAALPAPSVAHNEDLSHIQWLIKGALRASSKHKRECDLMRVFLHPDALIYLQGRMAESQVIYNVTSTLIHRSLDDGSFVHLNNLMVVLDGMNDSESNFSIAQQIIGLQARGSGTKKDWSKKDRSEWEKPQAIVKATQLLDQPYLDNAFSGTGTGTFIRSRELEELILKRPSDTERIAAILKERQLPVDTESEITSLVELLDQPAASALSRGLL